MTDSSHLTVRALLEALKNVPPETPVLGHAGWDFPIIECDHDEDGFVLFLDHEDTCSMVPNAWLQKEGIGQDGYVVISRSLLDELERQAGLRGRESDGSE